MRHIMAKSLAPTDGVRDYLAAQEKKSLLRFLTCGSVDDGKSTLIGRLLSDTKQIFEDQLAALERDSRKHGTTGDDIDFALLVDGLEAVDQQCEIDVVTRRAMLARIAFERGELILENLLGVGQQAPDQRRLAVIDRAAGQEAQQRLLLLRRQIVANAVGGGEALCHDVAHGQKYPSRFFFSIEPASSRSIRRPCRSDVRAVSISPTMASSVSASDSMAPVSG